MALPLVPALLLFAGCLFFPAGAWLPQRWVWGPFCLFVQTCAAACLWSRNTLPIGLDGSMFVDDPLAVGVQWMILGAGFLLTLTAFDAKREAPSSSEHFGLLLVMQAGVMLIGSANDLIALYLGLQFVHLPLFLLLYLDRATRAARNHLLMTVCVSAVLLCAFAFLYTLAGTTNLAEIRSVLIDSYAPREFGDPVGGGSRLGIVALILSVAALGLSFGLAPFHLHLPPLFQGASAWLTGLLATAPLAAGLLVIIRALTATLSGFEFAAELLTLVVAGFTVVIAGASAAVETRLRPLLAYLAIGHAGLLLAGLSVAFPDFAEPARGLASTPSLPGGVSAVLFALCVYLLAMAGLCGVVAYLARSERQLEFVDDLKGVARDEPAAAGAAAVLLLSLVGVPPLPGFWARLLLLANMLNVHAESTTMLLVPSPAFRLLAAATVLGLLFTIVAAVRLLTVMFLDDPVARPQPSGGQSALAGGMLAMLLTLGLGLLPGPLMSYWSEIPHPNRTTAVPAPTSQETPPSERPALPQTPPRQARNQ